MDTALVLGIATLVVTSPPAYLAARSSIRKDRADEATRLEARIEKARTEGRTEAAQTAEIEALKRELTALRQEPGGDRDTTR